MNAVATTLEELLFLEGLSGASRADQVVRLKQLMELPFWIPVPTPLQTEVDEFLAEEETKSWKPQTPLARRHDRG